MSKPKIRFNGFTEDWEQRKLGEIADIKTGPFGSTLHADDYVDDGIPIITTEHFKSGQLPTVKDDIPQVSDDDYLRLSSYTLKTDDIVFSRVGSVDINALVTPFQDKWLFSGRVLRVRPNAEVGSMFLHTLLETDDIRKDIVSRAVGQTMPSINTEILKITSLCLPQDIEEQHKIGVYFQDLDRLITLHQRKCEEIKKFKKYMLQKMFPKDGKSVPEIRFSGFTDAWEQRKLGELAEIVGGGTPSTSKSEYWDGDIDWYAPAEISDKIFVDESQRKISEKGFNSCSAKMLPVGTVLFTSRAGIGKTAILAKEGCTNQGFQSIVPYKDKLNSYFIFSRTEELKKYAETVGSGSTFVEVSGKQMSNMDLMMPPTIKEQTIIGEHFRNLDRLITLHQRKLESLRTLKKFMLEKMFV